MPAAAAQADIARTVGFVPSFVKAMPANLVPGLWQEARDFEMSDKTALSVKNKDLIALAIAAQMPSRLTVWSYTKCARANGASEAEIKEAVAMAALVRHWSTFFNGITGFTGQPATPSVLDAVHRATEGNPLFLDELLRLLLQRGELGLAEASSPAPTAPLPIPDPVREVIRRRFGRLTAETRELLGLASVAGREVALATLAAMAKTAASEVAARLRVSVDASLLVPVEPASYRFSHVLVREAVYRDLPPSRRAELHLELASLLEARGGDSLAEVAHHRLAALPAGDAAAAASAAQRAAERAMSMLAFEDAAVLLEQARSGLAAAGQLDPERAFELQLMAGLGFMRAGQGDRGRQILNAIRNAIVPGGVCVLLEPPVSVVLGGPKRGTAVDRLRALAEKAGFSKVSLVSRGSADVYELRR